MARPRPEDPDEPDERDVVEDRDRDWDLDWDEAAGRSEPPRREPAVADERGADPDPPPEGAARRTVGAERGAEAAGAREPPEGSARMPRTTRRAGGAGAMLPRSLRGATRVAVGRPVDPSREVGRSKVRGEDR